MRILFFINGQLLSSEFLRSPPYFTFLHYQFWSCLGYPISRDIIMSHQWLIHSFISSFINFATLCIWGLVNTWWCLEIIPDSMPSIHSWAKAWRTIWSPGDQLWVSQVKDNCTCCIISPSILCLLIGKFIFTKFVCC